LRKAAAHIKHIEALLANRQNGGRTTSAQRKGAGGAGGQDGDDDTESVQPRVETRYREVSDDRDVSTSSSTSENRDVKMEREGTDENEWRP
jgi:hypothetical protein